MSINVCSFGADRAFDEVASWPAQMFVSYFTLAFVSREPLFTIFFGYLWESFEMLVLVINQRLAQDHDSKFAQWAVDSGPLSWLVPPSSDAKARACIESPMTSLFYDPLIFVGAVLLWSVGVERFARIRYDEQRSFTTGWRRILWYVSVAFTTVFASRVVFSARLSQIGDVDRTDAFEPDLGLLMSTLIFIIATLLVPLRSGQRNGWSSVEARRTYLAWIVYALFVSYGAFLGILGSPLIGIQSSWIRIMIVMFTLFASTLLVGAVHIGTWAETLAQTYLRRRDGAVKTPNT